MSIPNSLVVGNIESANQGNGGQFSDPRASEIIGILEEVPQCRALSDQEKEIMAENILSSEQICNASTELITASNAELASKEYPTHYESCEQIMLSKEGLREIVCGTTTNNSTQETNPNKPDNPDDDFPLGKLFAFGSGALGFILYVLRFLKKFAEVGKEAKAAGESIGLLARGLKVLNREIRSLIDVMGEGVGLIKRFHEKVVLRLVDDFRSIIRRGFRKNKAEDASGSSNNKQVEQSGEKEVRRRERLHTNPVLIPVTARHDPIVGEPNRAVILEEIRALLQKIEYRKERKYFEKLGPIGQNYVVTLLINRWNILLDQKTPEARQKIEEYRQGDEAPYEGKLPINFVKEGVEKYLKKRIIGPLRIAALQNAAREISPAADIVMMQLIERSDFWNAVRPELYPDTSEALSYMSKLLINNWAHFDNESKVSHININQLVSKGKLPESVLDSFFKGLLRNRQYRRIFKLAPIYAQLLGLSDHYDPNTEQRYFRFINLRAERLLSAWEGSKDLIENIFGENDAQGRLPHELVGLTRTSFRISTTARQGITPSQTRWQYDPQIQEIFSGIELNLVKKTLIEESSKLSLYPEIDFYWDILDRRAKALVIDWNNLSRDTLLALLEQDKKSGIDISKIEVSISLTRLWLQINGSIGVSDRSAIRLNNNDPNNSGGGNTPVPISNGGTLGTPPVSNTNTILRSQGVRRGIMTFLRVPCRILPATRGPRFGANIFMSAPQPLFHPI